MISNDNHADNNLKEILPFVYYGFPKNGVMQILGQVWYGKKLRCPNI